MESVFITQGDYRYSSIIINRHNTICIEFLFHKKKTSKMNKCLILWCHRSYNAGMEIVWRRHLAARHSGNKEALHNTPYTNNFDQLSVCLLTCYLAAAAAACFCWYWCELLLLLLFTDQHEEEKKKNHIQRLIVCFLKANVNIYSISLPI